MGEIIVSICTGLCLVVPGVFLRIWLGREAKKNGVQDIDGE